MHAGKQADKVVLAAKREDRVDQVVADTCLALLDLEAVGEEVEEVALGNAETKVVVLYDADNTQRRTTKCEGVFRSGGLLIDREETAQRIQLVRQAHRHRHRCGRNVVALPDRLVVIADRVGDGIGQALGAGVVAAHQALQFGKLADHLGDQIGLGEPRRLFGHFGEVFPAQAVTPAQAGVQLA